MLTDSDIMAVLPAKDIKRAKEFYRDKLGLEPSESAEEDSLIYRGRPRNGLPRLSDGECRHGEEHPDGLGHG